MKILHVLWHSEFGGVENYTRSLFVELERRGHRNIVVLAGEKLEGVAASGRTVYHLPEVIDLRRASGPAILAHLGPILHREAPDVSYLHTAMNPQAASHLLARTPSVYFAHNYTAFSPSGALYYHRSRSICGFDRAPRWRCLFNAYAQGCNTRRPDRLLATYRRAQVTRRWVLRTDAVVCDSSYVADRHVRAGFDASRIHVLPSPVPIPEPLPASPAVAPPRLLFAGRLVASKGLEVVVRALPGVDSSVVLVVAGDGPQRPALARLAGALGVGTRVQFLGQLSTPELAQEYLTAAVVVVPSLWPEPLGMVGPEALSFARPVVGSGVGGMGEWLMDAVTGLVAPAGDPVALSRQVNRLLDDPALARRLGRAGRQLIEQRFSVGHHVDALLRVFEQVQQARGVARAAV
jgi:glycosyltransferase involved in cell wall biosynthesis